jgi:hypothetical protein
MINMAIPYGTRFAASFDQVFPMGALMVGEVAPDIGVPESGGQGAG